MGLAGKAVLLLLEPGLGGLRISLGASTPGTEKANRIRVGRKSERGGGDYPGPGRSP